MTHLDVELQQLKEDIVAMWNLVISQLKKTHIALVSYDQDLAFEVHAREKRVNSLELKIDRDCENIFALQNPVAVDLRFVLAVLKINNNLERTGDIADGIARFITESTKAFDKELLKKIQLVEMFEEANEMLVDLLSAFETDDTRVVRTIFKRDDYLDEINEKANQVIADYIRKNPDNTEQALYTLSSVRKLERVGDQSKNIAEEIIFYIEAKVMKHKHKASPASNN